MLTLHWIRNISLSALLVLPGVNIFYAESSVVNSSARESIKGSSQVLIAERQSAVEMNRDGIPTLSSGRI